MRRLLNHGKDRLLKFFLKQTVFCLIILFCLGIAIALSNMSSLSRVLIESQSLQNSQYQANAIVNAWQLYSQAVANRLDDIENVTISHDYFLRQASIPPPATFIIQLGQQITEDGEGTVIDLYSDYPYPWREDRPVMDFAIEALDYLRKNPQEKEYYCIEKDQESSRWQYAQAIQMDASCVSCHNNHPLSPKKDWGLGDVRGVLLISNPLDKVTIQTKKSLRIASLMLGSFSVLGISAVGLVVNRLNQNNKLLETKVKERTTDLASANEDLEKSNALIRQVFGRYLSNEVVKNLLDSPQSLKLGGERRKITILTSDLRGFTSISESLSAEEVITILNIYLKTMADIISQYKGTINEFMGDGILVLFGAPTAKKDDSLRAIACAIEMQLAMDKVNRKLKKLNFPQIEMGIGINTGFVVLGNIGSERRTKYGIVGREVNLTYRIESYTTGGQIFISESTQEECASILMIRGAKKVNPKGVREPIMIFDVVGIRGELGLTLPAEQEKFFDIQNHLIIEYSIVEEKQISSNSFRGYLSELSPKGAKVKVESKNAVLPVFTNLKINLLKGTDHELVGENIYGKVIDIFPDQKIFHLSFTSKKETIKTILQKYTSNNL